MANDNTPIITDLDSNLVVDFQPGTAATLIDTDVTLFDADLAAAASKYEGSSLTVEITGGVVAGDRLNIATPADFSWDIFNGELQGLSGDFIGTVNQVSDTKIVINFAQQTGISTQDLIDDGFFDSFAFQTDVNNVARAIQFENTTGSFSGNRTVSYTFDDGQGSAPVTQAILIEELIIPPEITGDLSGSADGAASGVPLGQFITAQTPGGSDHFGHDVQVSADGSIMVTGSYQDDDGGNNTGSVSVYVRNEITGLLEHSETFNHSSTSANDQFGRRVALSADGSTMLVSAPFDDNNGASSGAVFLYNIAADGSVDSGTELVIPTASANDEWGRSGLSLSSDGNVISIGARSDDEYGSNSGSAYVYTRDAQGNIGPAVELDPLDGRSGDGFGNEVLVSDDGSRIFVGSRDGDTTGSANNAGTVYQFDLNPQTGAYEKTTELFDPVNSRSHSYFGNNVAVSSDLSILAVGAARGQVGNVYNVGTIDIFVDSGQGYQHVTEAAGALNSAGDPATAGSQYGANGVAMSADGSLFVTGHWRSDNFGGASDLGEAIVYAFDGTSATVVARLHKVGGSQGDNYGHGVDISPDGQTIYIGSKNGDSPTVANSGSVLVFNRLDDGRWVDDQGNIFGTNGDTGETYVPSPFQASGQLDIINDDDAPLTFSTLADAAGDNGFGTFSMDATGAWTYTNLEDSAAFRALGAGEQGTETITVQDTTGAVTAQITVTVTGGQNDAPEAGDDTLVASAGEDTALVIAAADLLGNDSDPDTNDTFSISQVSGTSAQGATVTLNQDGTITYDPTGSETLQALNTGETQGDTFTYTITDGTETSTATVTLNVDGANGTPVAQSADITIDEDMALSGTIPEVLNGVDDEEGQALTVTGVTQGANGTVAIDDNDTPGDQSDDVLTYTPNDDFNGTDSFTYTVEDSEGASVTGTVNVTVTPVNDTPTISSPYAPSNSASIYEDFSVVLQNYEVGDADGDQLTVQLFAGNGTFQIAGVDVSEEVDFVQTYTLTGTAAEVNAALDQLSYRPTPNFNGSGSIQIDVSDGQLSATNTTLVGINPLNDAPLAVNDDLTATQQPGDIGEDQSQTIDVADILANDIDVDNDILIVSQVSATSQKGAVVTLSQDGTTITYDPTDAAVLQALDDGESTTDVITYSAADPSGTVSSAQVTIQVSGANDAPVVSIPQLDRLVNEGSTLELDVTPFTTDADGDDAPADLTYAGSVPNGQGSVSVDGGTITFDTGTDFESLGENESADVTVSVTAQDDAGDQGTGQFVVTVNGQNDNPEVVDGGDTTGSITEANTNQQTATGAFDVTDVDVNDVLEVLVTQAQFTLLNSPADPLTQAQETVLANAFAAQLASGNSNSDTVNWTFDPSAADLDFLTGDDSVRAEFTVQISDGKGGSTTQVVEVTVQGSNDAPVLAEIAELETLEDDAVQIDLAALYSDVDRGEGTIDLANVSAPGLDPLDGSLQINNGQLFFVAGSNLQTLTENELANFSFDIVVSDAAGADSNTRTVSVALTGQNDIAVIGGDTSGAIGEDEIGDVVPGQVVDADDAAQNDQFGIATAISADGKTMVVGSFFDDDAGPSTGSAYVYRLDENGQFQLAVKLIASDVADFDTFGRSVAVSDDGLTVIVGANGHDYGGSLSGAGAAYVYDFEADGTTFAEQKLAYPQATTNDALGTAVAVSGDGDTVLVGAPAKNALYTRAGEIYSAQRGADTDASGFGNFAPLGLSGLPAGQAVDENGRTLAVSEDGGVFVAGVASYDVLVSNVNVLDSGRVIVSGSNGNHVLLPTNPATGQQFGNDVAVSADGLTIAVGAYSAEVDDGNGGSIAGGSVSVFVSPGNGAPYANIAELTLSMPGSSDYFGFAIAMTKDASSIVVTAPRDDTDDGINVGSIAVFDVDPDTGSYEQSATLIFPAAESGSRWGDDVSISEDGNTLVVTSRYVSVDGFAQAGSAYVFRKQEDGTWADADGNAYDVNGPTGAPAVGAPVTTVTGQLTVDDVDTGESAFVPFNATTDYGTFAIDAAGAWTFEIATDSDSVQALGQDVEHLETFTVSSVDGTSEDVTITITGQNDAPTTDPDGNEVSVLEDDSISFNLFGEDVDEGDTLTYTVGEAGNGTVEDNGNGFTYTPDADFNGEDSFEYTVSDGKGGEVTATASVIVSPVNDAPVVSTGPVSASFNGYSDPYTVADADQLAAISDAIQASGEFTVEMWVKHDLGTESFELLTTGTEADGQLNIRIDDEGVIEVRVGEFTIFTPSGSVPLNTWTHVAVTLDEAANNGFVAVNGVTVGANTFTLELPEFDTFGIAGSADSGSHLMEGEIADLRVWNVRRDAADSGADMNGNVAADTPGLVANWKMGERDNNEGLVDSVAGHVLGYTTYDNIAYLSGAEVDGFVAGGAEDGSVAFNINISDIDAEPSDEVAVFVIMSPIEPEGDEGDGDAEPVYPGVLTHAPQQSVQVLSQPNGIEMFGQVSEIQTLLRSLTFTPNPDFNGVVTGIAAMTDLGNTGLHPLLADEDGSNDPMQDELDSGLSTGLEFQLVVNPVNDAPIADDEQVTTDEDTPVTIDVLDGDTDIDGDDLEISAVENGGNGTTEIVNGQVVYTPDENSNGPDSFTYTVSDGAGGTSQATVNIEVSAVNDAAIFGGDLSGAVSENTFTPDTGTVTASDVDNADNTFTASVQESDYGTLALNADGTWTYTLDEAADIVNDLTEGDTVLDTFTIQSVDGTETTLTITINGAVDAPPSVTIVDGGDDIVGISDTANAFVQVDIEVPSGIRTGDTLKLSYAYGEGNAVNILDTVADVTEGVVTFASGAIVDTNAAESLRVLVPSAGSNGDQLSVDASVVNAANVETGSVSDVAVVDVVAPPEGPAASAIDENPEAGAVIAAFAAFDAGGQLTHSLSVNPGEAFALVTLEDGSAELRVSDPSYFNFENFEEGETIDVDVTSTDLAGNVVITTHSVTVINVNDRPELVDSDGNTFGVTLMERADGAENENEASGFSSSGNLLFFTDEDAGDFHFSSINVASTTANVPLVGQLLAGVTPIQNGQGTVNWSFEVVDPAHMAIIDGLPDGESLVQVFEVSVSDNSFSDTSTLVIPVSVTIMGTNDAPVISAELTDGAGALDEQTLTTGDATLLSESGTITFSDVDLDANDAGEPSPDVHTASFELVSVAHTREGEVVEGEGELPIGTFDLSEISTSEVDPSSHDLTWSFDIADQDVDFLAEDDVLTVVYKVIVDDESDTGNATAEQLVTLTLTGKNDAPAALDVTGEVNEDGPTIEILPDFTDVDSDDTHSFSIDTTGTAGSVVLSESGDSFIYDPNGQFEALNFEDEATDTFTYTVTDANGATSTKTVTVTITGQNDVPTLDVTQGEPLAATEDGGAVSIDLTQFGADRDAEDNGDSLSYSVTGQPAEGSASISEDGNSLVFTPGEAFQDLGLGETRTVDVVIEAEDAQGATVSDTLTVEVTGTNDTPEITVPAPALVDLPDPVIELKLDGDLVDSVSGIAGTVQNYAVQDSLNGVINFVDGPVNQAGVFEGVNPQGLFPNAEGVSVPVPFGTYPIDNEARSVAFWLKSDHSGGDFPEIILSYGSPEDGGNLIFQHFNGTFEVFENQSSLAVVDGIVPDDDWVHLAMTHEPGGSLRIYADGIQVLEVDAPVLNTGNFTPFHIAGIAENNFPFFNGALDEVVVYDQSLSPAQVATLYAAGGTPVAGGDSDASFEGSVTEADDNSEDETNDVTHQATGTIEFTDVDVANVADTHSVSFVSGDDELEPVYVGAFSLGDVDAQGGSFDWTFEVDDSVIDGLAGGEVLTQTYTVSLKDNSGDAETDTVETTVTVTINGTNDVPVAVDVSAAAGEDETFIVIPADFSDVDVADNNFGLSFDSANTVGSVANLGNGTFRYDLNGQFEYLDAGDTATDTFTYRVDDRNGGVSEPRTVTVTITGANDGPVISTADAVRELSEPETLGADGSFEFSDPDADDVADAAIVGVSVTGTAGDYGATDDAAILAMLGLENSEDIPDTDAVGWSFAAEPADFAYLTDGATITLDYSIRITDTGGATATHSVSITVTGTNATPAIASATTGSTVTENGSAVAMPAADSGTDTGTLNPGASNWSDADAGETAGLNVTAVASGTETPQPVDFDDDNEVVVSGIYGDLTVNRDGSYTYVLDQDREATQALNDADTGVEDVFTYVISNGADEDDVAQSTYTAIIDGANDAPTIAASTVTAPVTEDEGLTPGASGNLSDNGNWDDVDAGEDALLAVTGASAGAYGESTVFTAVGEDGVDIVGTYGTLTIAADGSYSYVLDDSNPLTDALDENDPAQDVFSYRIANGEGLFDSAVANITVGITGANDAPVAVLDAPVTVGEDDTGEAAAPAAVLDVLANDTDVDGDDGPSSFSLQSFEVTGFVNETGEGTDNPLAGVQATAAALGLTQSGNQIAFTPSSAFDAMDAGDTATVTISYVVADDSGATATGTASIVVIGANDDVTIDVQNSGLSGMVTETAEAGETEGDSHEATGTISFLDVDANDVHTVTFLPQGEDYVGGLVFDPVAPAARQTDWTFTVFDADIEHLGADDMLVQVYDVTVTDEAGVADTRTLTITVNGSDDAPEISADTVGDPLTEQGGVNNDEAGVAVSSGSLNPEGSNWSDPDQDQTESIILSSVTSDTSEPTAVAETGETAVDGVYGTLYVTADGGYRYELDDARDATQELDQDDARTESFSYVISGETGSVASANLTFGITGTNDTPVITASGTDIAQTVSETPEGEGNIVAEGSLALSDVDKDDGVLTVTVDGVEIAKGSTVVGMTADNAALAALLSLDFDGNDGDAGASVAAPTSGGVTWAFSSAETVFDYLASGESITLNYTISATDGQASTSQIVAITVDGTNDIPVITVSDPSAVTEGDSLITSEGEGEIVAPPEAAESDVVTVDLLTGTIAEGSETRIVSVVDLDASDETSVTAVALTDETSAGVLEDIGFDTAEVLAAFSIDGSSVTYNRNALVFDRLDEGEEIRVRATFDVTSGPDTQEDESVVIVISGANDTPYLLDTPSAPIGTITELLAVNEEDPEQLTFATVIEYDDIELTDTHIAFVIPVPDDETPAVGDYLGVPQVGFSGVATQDGIGRVNWNYFVEASDLEFLTEGQTITQKYRIQISDGKDLFTQDFELTLHGTNDTPTVNLEFSTLDAVLDETADLTDDAATITTGATIVVNDVDTDDNAAVLSPNGDLPTVGDITFVSATHARDGEALDTQPEGAIGSVSTSLVAPFGEGSGQFAFNWLYLVPNRDLDFLAAGDTLTVLFDIDVDDGSDAENAIVTERVEIVVTGTNDAPQITGGPQTDATLAEAAETSMTALNAGDLQTSGTVEFTDVDTGDSHTATVAGVVTSGDTGIFGKGDDVNFEGMLTVAEGPVESGFAWNFSAAESVFDRLTKDQSITLTYTVEVTDQNSGTDTEEISIVIAGSNDSPEIASATVSETAAVEAGGVENAVEGTPEVSGNLRTSGSWSDIDDGETDLLVVSGVDEAEVDAETGEFVVQGVYGSLSVAENGDYTYTLDDGDEETEALETGEMVTDEFTYEISDGNGGVTTSTVTINVTGANDAPVAADDIGLVDIVDEDATEAVLLDVLANDTDADAPDSPANFSLDSIVSVNLNDTGENIAGFGDADATAKGVTLNNGRISFLPTAIYEELDAGDTAEVAITYEMSDDEGATSQAVAFVSVRGANDAPEFTNDAPEVAPLAETGEATDPGADAGGLITSGTLAFADVDADDVHTSDVVGITLSGDLAKEFAGSLADLDVMFSTNVDSETKAVGWTFTGDESAFDFLRANDAFEINFEVEVRDSNDATATQVVGITIEGANDGPFINTVVTTEGVVEAGGVANADAGTAEVFGHLNLGGENWSDLDFGDEAGITVSGLVAGSGEGVAVGVALFETGESGASEASVTGTYGTLYVQEDGSFRYVLDNEADATQQLDEGEPASDVFTYEISDAGGLTSTSTVSISITGSNDTPVATATDPVETLEDQAEGDLGEPDGIAVQQDLFANITDADDDAQGNSGPFILVGVNFEGLELTGDVSFTAQELGSTPFEVEAGGGTAVLRFAPGPLFDELDVGDTVVVTVPYTVMDAQGATVESSVRFNVTGSNDGPVIASGDETFSASGTAPETDDVVTVTGQILFSDVDKDDTPEAVIMGDVTVTPTNITLTEEQEASLANSLTLTPDTGAWEYSIEAEDTQFLSEGSKVEIAYMVKVSDDNGSDVLQPLTVTITGSNDDPVITAQDGSTEGTVSEDGEDGQLIASGAVSVSDIDDGASLTASVTGVVVDATAASGTPELDDAALQALLTVASALDGTFGASAAVVDTVAWSFDATAPAFQYLGDGEQLDLVYTVEVADAEGGSDTVTVTVSVTGSNDGPTLVVADTLTHVESVDDNVPGNEPVPTRLDAAASLVDADSDGFEGATLHIAILDIQPTDEFALLEDLGAVATDTEILIDGTAIGTFAENEDFSLTVTFNADATTDSINALMRSLGYATSEDNPAEETATRTIEVSFDDGSGTETSASNTETMTVTIVPSNDSPVAVDDFGVATQGGNGFIQVLPFVPGTPGEDYDPEGDTLKVVGVTDILDVDGDPNVTVAATAPVSAIPGFLTTDFGASLTVLESGTIIYNASSATAFLTSLGAGQMAVDTFTYEVSDGALSSFGTVSVTLTGTNDQATAGADTIVVDEAAGTGLSGNLLDNDSDPDASDVLTVASVAGGDASVAQQGDGSFLLTYANGVQLRIQEDGSYAVENIDAANVDGLSSAFTYNLSDGSGTLVQGQVSIDVAGENDAAVIDGDILGTAVEDSGVDVTGQLTVTDVDNEETFNAAAIAAAYGTLTITAGGAWTYVLDDSNPDVDALAFGESIEDTITVSSSDGTTQDIVITIEGGNLGPVAQNDIFSVSETATSLSGNVFDDNGNGADVDQDGSPLSVTALNGAATIGVEITLGSGALLTLNADGTFVYNQNGVFDNLSTGQSGNDTFTYDVTDGLETETATVTVTIVGSSASVTEGDDVLTGTSGDEDVDLGAGDDVYSADAGDDEVDAGDGDDIVIGGSGDDMITGGTGADFLQGGADNDTFFATVGGDGIWEDSRFAIARTMEHTNGNADFRDISGNLQHNDVYDGGTGIDTLEGTAGDDIFIAFDGRFSPINDALDPTAQRIIDVEIFNLGEGRDTLLLGTDPDSPGASYDVDVTVNGGGGSDFIILGTGNDIVDGGEGVDFLVGGIGNDTLTGGLDSFDFFGISDIDGAGVDTITDFTDGVDRLRVVGFQIDSGNFATALGDGSLSIVQEGLDTRITLTDDFTAEILLNNVTSTDIGVDDFLFAL